MKNFLVEYSKNKESIIYSEIDIPQFLETAELNKLNVGNSTVFQSDEFGKVFIKRVEDASDEFTKKKNKIAEYESQPEMEEVILANIGKFKTAEDDVDTVYLVKGVEVARWNGSTHTGQIEQDELPVRNLKVKKEKIFLVKYRSGNFEILNREQLINKIYLEKKQENYLNDMEVDEKIDAISKEEGNNESVSITKLSSNLKQNDKPDYIFEKKLAEEATILKQQAPGYDFESMVEGIRLNAKDWFSEEFESRLESNELPDWFVNGYGNPAAFRRSLDEDMESMKKDGVLTTDEREIVVSVLTIQSLNMKIGEGKEKIDKIIKKLK